MFFDLSLLVTFLTDILSCIFNVQIILFLQDGRLSASFLKPTYCGKEPVCKHSIVIGTKQLSLLRKTEIRLVGFI